MLVKFEDLGVTKKSKILKNGTKLLVFEKPNSPLSISIVFFAGHRFDPISKEGTAHLLEHMLMAGTKDFPSKDKIASFIEGLGGVNGARIGDEIFNIYIEAGDPADLEKCFYLLSQELNHSLFNKKTFLNERNSIVNEEKSSKASAGYLLSKELHEMTFQETNLARLAHSQDQTVAEVSLDDILKFKKNHLTGNRMAIIVSGGVTFNEVEEQVLQTIYLDRGDEVNITSQDRTRNYHVAVKNYEPLEDQVKFTLAYIVDIPYLHPDIYPLSIIRMILGGGRASILSQKLRYEKGLVYSVSAGINSYIETAGFGVGGSTQRKDLDEVLKIIKDTIYEITQKGFSKDQIQFAKDRVIKSMRRHLQTSYDFVEAHEYSALAQMFSPYKNATFLENERTVLDYYFNIEKVTNEDILRVAKKYFRDDNWFLALVGNGIEREKYF